MLRQVIFRSGYLGRNAVRHNASTLVTKRNSATVAAAQSLQEEWDTAKPFEDIPGPKPLPVVGNIWRFLPYIGNLSTDLISQYNQLYKEYGEIYKLTHLPGINNMVFVFNPEDMEKVFRNEGPWPMRTALESLKYYRYVTRKDVYEGIGGTIVTQGEEWHSFRSKVNPILMHPNAPKMYVAPIDAVANDFIERLRNMRDENLETPENFIKELHKWALESIIYIGLDTRMGCLANDLKPDSEPQKIIDALEVIFETSFSLQIIRVWKYISTSTWRKFVKACDFYNEVCIKYINEAKERLKTLPTDGRELTVLEKLLTRDSNPKTAMVMAIDMFSAGVETTSYSTILALYYLAKNPEKQEILFEEVRHYLPDRNVPVTLAILNEMKYLKACIKESMRITPIVPGNIRTLTKDLVVAGYRIPKGTDVAFPNIHLCKNEKHFREANKFIPERWIKQNDESRPEAKNAHPFVFMPFGFGPRMCLGRRFAELEMEVILAKMIRNFRIEYNYEDPKFRSTLLYIPVTPLKFKLVDRE